ncbi:MAG TPA: hypothetical protein VGD95_00215 [Micavibrio sp.]
MSTTQKILASSLLAGAAAFAGFAVSKTDGKDPRADLEGMVNATQTACPVYDKDDSTRLTCATVGQKQAKKLFDYSGIGPQFSKVCSFTAPTGVPDFAKPRIMGSDASKCLKAVEDNAGDAVTKKVARDVRIALAQGLGR